MATRAQCKLQSMLGGAASADTLSASASLSAVSPTTSTAAAAFAHTHRHTQRDTLTGRLRSLTAVCLLLSLAHVLSVWAHRAPLLHSAQKCWCRPRICSLPLPLALPLSLQAAQSTYTRSLSLSLSVSHCYPLLAMQLSLFGLCVCVSELHVAHCVWTWYR